MYHKLVSDSSSLILLTKARLIEPLLRTAVLIIPEGVYEESVKISKEKGYKDAYELESYIQTKKITIERPRAKVVFQLEQLFKIGGGEKEALALALERKLPMLCDDQKGRNAAKALHIPTLSAVSMVEALYRKKAITKNAALQSFHDLEAYGWYKKEIIMSLRRRIKDAKANISENTETPV